MKSGKIDVAFQRLLVNLQDSDPVLRIHAATTLGTMGEDARNAVPILIEMLHHGDILDRQLAVFTLGEIGPAAEAAIPALFAAVDDVDETLAELAEFALEQVDRLERHNRAA